MSNRSRRRRHASASETTHTIVTPFFGAISYYLLAKCRHFFQSTIADLASQAAQHIVRATERKFGDTVMSDRRRVPLRRPMFRTLKRLSS